MVFRPVISVWPKSNSHDRALGSFGAVRNGKIVAVDSGRKLVTLEGQAGRRVTVWVQNPDSLRAAKVGEPFAARFYDALTIRKKKPGENVQSATTVGVWTTNPLRVPGGSFAQLTSALVTIDAIDEAGQ
jgi:hypothetical protein